jgi:hypothetical protein
MWTSTGRPAGSPASSTARVRPSGVRTVRSTSALRTRRPGQSRTDVSACDRPSWPDASGTNVALPPAIRHDQLIRRVCHAFALPGHMPSGPCLLPWVSKTARAHLSGHGDVAARQVLWLDRLIIWHGGRDPAGAGLTSPACGLSRNLSRIRASSSTGRRMSHMDRTRDTLVVSDQDRAVKVALEPGSSSLELSLRELGWGLRSSHWLARSS